MASQGVRGVRIGVEHGGHERPVQLPARGDLAAEAAAELAVVREPRVDELDGHQLPSPVGREEDLTHPTRAQPCDQLIRTHR